MLLILKPQFKRSMNGGFPRSFLCKKLLQPLFLLNLFRCLGFHPVMWFKTLKSERIVGLLKRAIHARIPRVFPACFNAGVVLFDLPHNSKFFFPIPIRCSVVVPSLIHLIHHLIGQANYIFQIINLAAELMIIDS